jgi:flagellar hook assembly protein FlgD
LDFRVYKKETFILQRVSNYPNPFNTSTNFCFELENGQIGKNVEATIQLYSVTGQLVRTLKKAIKFTAKRSCEIVWDGRNENGSKMGTGIYVYVLYIKPPSGNLSRKVGKLYYFNY